MASHEQQLRRGTTAEHATFTGAAGEVTVDTDKKTLVVHDAATAGGTPLAKAAASSTDNAVVRFDGATGAAVQNSGVTVSDANNVAGVGNLTATSITINGAADSVVAAIRGSVGHTADVFEVQNSAASPLFEVSAAGTVNIPTGQTYNINGSAHSHAAFTGDAGAGGTLGMVPAPAAGDAAASKYLKADGSWTAVTGTGDVVGPGSATDNAVARFDSTTGKLIQNSTVTVSDGGNVTASSVTINGAADALEVAIRANAGQTAEVFQVQTSAAALLFSVSPAGSTNIPTGQTYNINGSAHTHTASGISDSTAAGRSMITAADAAAQLALLGITQVGDPAANSFLVGSASDYVEKTLAQTKTILGVDAATTSASGVVELATTAEIDAATPSRAMSNDQFKASNFGKRVVGVQVFDIGTDVATGDRKAAFRIPATMNGMNLVAVAASVVTAGTTNTTDVQVRNSPYNAGAARAADEDMLSTKLTIDSGDTDSAAAAAAAVIDGAHDDVATGDLISIDVDAVSTTAPKGLYVELMFALP